MAYGMRQHGKQFIIAFGLSHQLVGHDHQAGWQGIRSGPSSRASTSRSW
jgi:hypothetical protein